MKKHLKVCMYGLMAVMLVSGCSQKTDSSAESTTAESTAAGSETQGTETAVSTENSVVLGNYKGVTFTPVSAEVTDEEIEEWIQSMIEANPVLTEVDRAAEEGDVVNIDYVGKKDGVAFDGGTDQGFDLTLGSGRFIDGFEDGLIGAKAGEEINLNLTFPEDYFSEDLAGQDVVFEVKVNMVQESVKAELTDEFIAENTDSSTVEEYRAEIRKEMEEAAQENALNQKKSEVFLKVVEDSQVTVSEEEVQAYYEEQRATYEQQAQMFGMDLETMVSYYGTDLESFEQDLMESSREGCKQSAVVRAIAEAENIEVEENDLKELAESFGYPDVDTMIENAGEETVNIYVLTEKVVTFIADHAVEEG